MKDQVSFPISARDIIPHAPSILMIDKLIDFKDCACTVEAIVSPDNIMLDENNMLNQSAIIEIIAQASAAFKGCEDKINGKELTRGFLVGIKKIQFHNSVFSGDKILINIKITTNFSGFTVMDGKVLRDGQIIASASMKLWVPEQS